MIYIENVILRTMEFEYFNNSLYFESYKRLLEKIHIYHGTKTAKNFFWIGYPGLKPRI